MPIHTRETEERPSPAAAHGVSAFRFEDIPAELQLKVMLELDFRACRKLMRVSRLATLLFYHNYQTFLKRTITNASSDVRLTGELSQIICRILQLRSDQGLVPFRRSPAHWIAWMKNWRSCNATHKLPPFPRTIENLQRLYELISSLSWWTQRLSSHLERLPYEDSDNYPATTRRRELLRIVEPEQPHMPFSAHEKYRLQRGLLIWHMYCLIFHQSATSPDHLKNGRISEQMMFLSSLSLPLLCELDAIYDLMEDIIKTKFRLCCRSRDTSVLPARLAEIVNMCRTGSNLAYRTAGPLRNDAAPTSSALVEYIISLGLTDLQTKMNLPGGIVAYPPAFPNIDGSASLWWTQNRFYALPLARVLDQQLRGAVSSLRVPETDFAAHSHLVRVYMDNITEYDDPSAGKIAPTNRPNPYMQDTYGETPKPMTDAKILENHEYYRTKALALWDEGRIQRAAEVVRRLQHHPNRREVLGQSCWCQGQRPVAPLQTRGVPVGVRFLPQGDQFAPVRYPRETYSYSIFGILRSIMPAPIGPQPAPVNLAHNASRGVPQTPPTDAVLVQEGGMPVVEEAPRPNLPPHPSLPGLLNFDPPVPYRSRTPDGNGGQRIHRPPFFPPLTSTDGMQFDKWLVWDDNLAEEVIGGPVEWLYGLTL